MFTAKIDHYRVTAMTGRRKLPHCRITDRQQEVANIAGRGEPQDPTIGDVVNQRGDDEQPWTLTGLLKLGQDDQNGQVT
jgi:hypothetical protein